MSNEDKLRIEKEIDNLLQLYLPDDYYEEIRHKLIRVIGQYVDSKFQEIFDLKEQIKQLKQERNKAIDECIEKYNSLWISRIVNGLKPTPDEVLNALESLKRGVDNQYFR